MKQKKRLTTCICTCLPLCMCVFACCTSDRKNCHPQHGSLGSVNMLLGRSLLGLFGCAGCSLTPCASASSYDLLLCAMKCRVIKGVCSVAHLEDETRVQRMHQQAMLNSIRSALVCVNEWVNQWMVMRIYYKEKFDVLEFMIIKWWLWLISSNA